MVLILNILEAIGLFPYKVNDDFAEAAKTWKFLVKFYMWSVLVISLEAFAFTYYLNGPSEWIEVMFEVFKGSTTDLVALGLMTLSLNIMVLWLTWKNTRLSTDIADYLNFLQNITRYKFSPQFISILFLYGICGAVLGIGFLYPLLADGRQIAVILFSFAHFICITWSWSTTFVFLWGFSATTEMLCIWISKIKDGLHVNQNPTNEIIRLNQDGLKRALKVFSDTLVVLIPLLLVCLILASYATLSFLVSTHFNFGKIILTIGYVLSDIMMIRMLYSINMLSQKVMDGIAELKEQIILKDYNSISKPIEVLNTFEGFDCNGYFTLGRPLLTSITATFVTYIIILLQFKISDI